MSKRKTPIAKDLPKRFANASYRRTCTEPLPWLVKAKELRRCAEVLYPRAMLDGSKAALYGISSGDRIRIDALIARIQSVLPTEEQALESYVRNSGS